MAADAHYMLCSAGLHTLHARPRTAPIGGEQLSAAKTNVARVKAQDERNVFVRYDVDGDGYLNLDEMGLAALQVFHCCF